MLLRLSISLISAAAIGYEILLIRLFSIIQWHHFAYMIISLALLGFGASGTFLVLFHRKLAPRFADAFIGNAILFGLSSAGSFILAQRVPFNALEVIWDSHQPFYLLTLYLLLLLPFFFAANCIGLCFSRFKEGIHKIYRFDLMGAGVGALGIIAALFVFSPTDCLRLISALGFLAGALASLDKALGQHRWRAATLILYGLVISIAWPSSWMELRLSEYKGLKLALNVPGTEVLSEHTSPLAQLTVVRSATVPFRHAPGLSLASEAEPPPQLGIFSDGDSLSVITRYDGQRESVDYLDFLSQALPYHLLEHPNVLVLGAGGGSDVLLAAYHEAHHVDAVELNPQIVKLVAETYAEFAGDLYKAKEIQTHIAEARSFLARRSLEKEKPYDLIQVALLDSFSAAAAGLYALTESYLYTTEALQEYLRHLNPGGFLAITRWLKLPPRDGLKLFATAIEVLKESGVDEPGQQLALIRSWKTTTLLIKQGKLTEGEIEEIRKFCESRSFDVAYYPGMIASEANRYNRLDKPYFFEGARALLGEGRDDFLERYKFHIVPATDNQPYFFRFFKWRALSEILSLRERGGLPLMEWGYPILILTLGQAVAASLLLILFPLWWLQRRAIRRQSSAHIGFYFLTLGLAFLFIEIAFIQRFILFLGHPLYAIAVVLASFLVFAGLGSGFSSRLAQSHRAGKHPSHSKAVTLAVCGIVLVALTYLFILPSLFHRLMELPDMARVALSMVLIAPLAFCMGMPFPLGLAWLADRNPEWIPWAWGVNGCASVLSVVLATLLAIHFGFTWVVGSALILYVMAALTLRRVPSVD